MTDKITLATVGNLQDTTTAQTTINNNFATIQAAMDITLSRDGTTPNQMGNSLDMNSNQILNLPAPGTVDSPVRLIDVTGNPTITVPPVGTSGATVGLLNANKTDSGNNTFSGSDTFSGSVTLPSNTVTNSELAQVTAHTIKGNNTGSTANAADLTVAQVNTMLGTWTNQQSTKTANYTVVAADNATTLILGGSAFFTLTLNAASTYPSNFFINVVNLDARGKVIACNGLSSFILWPNQTCTIYNTNNIWSINPVFQRWKAPRATVIYVDAINGNDANDGLVAGSGGALKTLQQALRVNVKDYFDLSGFTQVPIANIVIQLADNASAGVAGTNAYNAGHLAFDPVGAEGRCAILIQGNASSPSNVVIADTSSPSISCFAGLNLELRNLQLGQTGTTAPIANGGLSASDGARIRLEGGVIFGTATNAQMEVDNGGTITLDGPISVVGNGSWLCEANSGSIALDGQVITFSNSPAYSQQTLFTANQGQITCVGTTYTNGGTVTGTRYAAQSLSLINTNLGTPNTTIPGSVNGSFSGGSQVL
jgi:hypothetical protein